LATLASDSLDRTDNIHSFNNGTKDDVLSIEPSGFRGTEEELGPVGVWSGVGHGQDTRTGVLQSEVFVRELSSVDGFSSGSVVVCKVSSLTHETRDDTVERGSRKAESLLSGTETTEVLSCLWDDIGTKFHDDTSGWSAANGDIKEYSWKGPGVVK